MTYNINSKDGFYSNLYTSDDTLTITAPKAIKIGNDTTDTQHTTHIVGGGGVTIGTDVDNSNNINLLSKTYIVDLEVINNIKVNKKITTTDLTVTNTIDGKINWTNVLNRPNRALSATDGGNANQANTIYLPRESVDYNIIPGANTLNVKEISGSSTNNAPTAIWYHVYTGQGSDANYQTQLALGMTGQAVYYRNRTSSTWQNWRRLLFADEHKNTTYTLSSPANANTIVLTNSDNNNAGTITLKADTPIVLTGTNSNEISISHSTDNGYKHIPSNGSSGQFLAYDSAGTAKWVDNPNTDTKVTSVNNHYTPAENTSSQLSVDASSTTAATWNSTSLVTGVDIKRDAKGHVTGIAVDSIKMPANPNTNTTYTLSSPANANTIVLTPSSGSPNTVTLKAGNNVTLDGGTAGEITISSSLSLGEGSSNAYYGDKGKIAYDHSQTAHAPSNAQANQNAFSNVAIDNTTIAADNATDTLTLVAGDNITLTPDATNDKITIAATNTTYGNATTSSAGLMSSEDKTKLNGIESGANKTTIDSSLSSTSTNSVQNKVINTALGNKVDKDGSKVLSDNNYTTTEKNKLSGIASGAEVNQNAFSIIGDTNGTAKISANAESTTLKVVGGGATTVSYDDTNKKLTISSTDNNTTYTALKNPNALYFRANDDTSNTDSYDGSAAKYINIKNGGNMTIGCSTSNNVVTYTITGTDNTTYSAGSGLSLSGDTFNHSNSIAEGTAAGSADNTTLAFGGSFTVPYVTYDAQGHITGSGTRTMKMPSNPNTDTSVTSVDNHYSPQENTSSAISASGGTLTDIANSSSGTQVVTGLKRDAKGHVVGVTSVALKATNSTYTIPTVNNKTITLRAGSSSSYTAIDSFTLNQSTDKTIYIPLASTTTQGLIPKTETANNAKFLRNDNTWQTVTPANIGAAPTHDHPYLPLTGGTLTGDLTGESITASGNLYTSSGLTSVGDADLGSITNGWLFSTDCSTSKVTINGTLYVDKILLNSNNKLGIAYASSASGNYQSGLRIGDITPGNTSYTTLCNDTICANSLNVKGGFTAAGTTYITGTSTGTPTSSAYIIFSDTSNKLYKSTVANISSLISANVKSTVSLQTDNPITATDNTKARNYFTIPLNNNTNQKILVMWGFIIPSASNALLGKKGMTITFPTSFRVIPMVYASPYGFGRMASNVAGDDWEHAELRIYDITTSSFSVAYNHLTDSPDEYLTKILWYAIGIAPTTL